jgi:hypothetical protein
LEPPSIDAQQWIDAARRTPEFGARAMHDATQIAGGRNLRSEWRRREGGAKKQ